jgi:phosphate transport system substrate-binding protein
MIPCISSLLLSLALLPGCAPRPEPAEEIVLAPEIGPENYPRLDGSTSAEPILATIACHFLDLTCQWVEWLDGDRLLLPVLTENSGEFPGINSSGTHQAYLNLIQSQVDLILVARKPSEEESRLAAIAGTSLEVQPVALDAFVFIVNDENPVVGLTTSQIQQIYTGQLENWKQVGGPDLEIHPYQRNDESGSQELMQTLVMKGAKMIDAPDMVLLTMIAPFNAVSKDIQGIGYSVYFYEENMAASAEQVKLLAVDGVVPGKDTIQTYEYPFTAEVYAVIRNDLPNTSLPHQLFKWLFTPEGQALISESGYIPLN